MESSKYNCYYSNNTIYNTLSRIFISLDCKSYASILKNQLNNFSKEELIQLQSIGFITSVDEFEVLNKNINEIKYSFLCCVISLTSKCNLGCSYCYEKGRIGLTSEELTLEKWNILKFYLKEQYIKLNKQELKLTLYGGEPLLNYKMVNTILNDEYFINNKVNVSYSIISNGTLLPKLIENDDYKKISDIQITLDGDKSNHDNIRKYSNKTGSFEDIYNNIIKLSRNFFNNLTLRINVNKDSTGIELLLDRLSNDGLKNFIKAVDIHWIFSESDSNVQCETSNDDFEKVYNYYKYAKSKGFTLKKAYLKGPCSAVSNDNNTFDENLNAYECIGFIYRESFAKLNEKSSLVKTNAISTSNLKECIKTCKYAPICFGGCLWTDKNCENKFFFDHYLEKYLLLCHS